MHKHTHTFRVHSMCNMQQYWRTMAATPLSPLSNDKNLLASCIFTTYNRDYYGHNFVLIIIICLCGNVIRSIWDFMSSAFERHSISLSITNISNNRYVSRVMASLFLRSLNLFFVGSHKVPFNYIHLLRTAINYAFCQKEHDDNNGAMLPLKAARPSVTTDKFNLFSIQMAATKIDFDIYVGIHRLTTASSIY